MMTKIYVATHKAYAFPSDKNYIPFHVGKSISKTSLPYLGDNEGDSISDLNECFCELTGLYWLWKHANDPIIGLVHYRRYFSFKKKLTHVYYNPIATTNDFPEFTQGVDLIVPNKMIFGRNLTVKEHYALVHRASDLDVVREIIVDRHPDYVEAFDSIMGEKEIFVCNMFISKNAIMKDYANWLFDILFQTHKMIDLSSYEDSYQKRVFGFLSERLFNVWVEKNKDRLTLAFRKITEIKEKPSISKRTKYHLKKLKSFFGF